jgi:ABC-2 type transport system ATP-binding protein
VQLAIETQSLARSFGRQRAVDGIDLSVPERAVYGFLGQNGAGKTTTIRMLLGLLKPSAGSARIFGLDVARQRCETARLIGAMVETPCHYDHLSGRANLDITRRLLGAAPAEIDRVLELVELADAANRRVGGYSLGMKQRLGVARALIGGPKLLILDEPTNGLDPNGIRDMRRLIGSLPEREGVTLLGSSHVLAEIEQVATHLGLMHSGRLIVQAPVAELKARQTRSVRFRVDKPGMLLTLLGSIGIDAAIEGPGLVRVAETSSEAAARDVATINFMMVERGIAVSGIEVAEPSLEDIFVRTVSAPAPAGAALKLAA